MTVRAPAWMPGVPLFILNPPTPEATLALAADRIGAIGAVDPSTTDASAATAIVVRPGGLIPAGPRFVLLEGDDERLASRLSGEGRIVLAVAHTATDVPSAHGLVARATTARQLIERVRALTGEGAARPVFAWGPVDRQTAGALLAAGVSGFVLGASLWALPESPLGDAEKSLLGARPDDGKLASFVLRRSRNLARALADFWSDANAGAKEAPALPPKSAAPVVAPSAQTLAPPAVSVASTLPLTPEPSASHRDSEAPRAAGASASLVGVSHAPLPTPTPPSSSAFDATAVATTIIPGAATSAASPPPLPDSVAIIGMGCVFPGARGIDAYWRLLTSGASAIREVNPARWNPDLFYNPDPKAPEKTYSKIGGFIDEVAFNSLEFKMPPNVAKSLDEVQKMALLAAKEAFEDAGYQPLPGAKGKAFDRTRCAVVLGNALGGERIHATDRRIHFAEIRDELARAGVSPEQTSAIETAYKSRLPEITEDTMPGELSNVTAGRVANVMDLGGKNHITDAACAATLAAIDSAMQTLIAGAADMVVTGGADRSMDVSTYVKFSKIGALSGTGSKPFDADADGFVQGEGAGVIILKRLADAIRDHDKIYAVVRCVGSSSDGRGKGITAPNPEGQKLAVRRAFAAGGLAPSTIQYVECHGTGTPVGDPVELESLAAIFHGAPARSVPVGSVKSQIGHLKSAAGAAAMIKTTLALHHHLIPPTINVRVPNPRIPWNDIPFYPATQAQPFPAPLPNQPLRAGVSAFGFGGTNYHIIVERYEPAYHDSILQAPAARQAGTGAPAAFASPALSPAAAAAVQGPPIAVFVAGGATVEELAASVSHAQAKLASLSGAPQADRAEAASRGRRAAVAQRYRAATADPAAFAAVKPGADARALALKGVFVGSGRKEGKVAFLFPGQGSQYAGMLLDLAQVYPVVRATFDEADAVLAPLLGAPLSTFLQDDAALARTEITQPAVLTADIALYRLLRQWKIAPDAVAGHSLGEYAALVAAGVMRFDDALRAVSARGREMAQVKVADPGLMAAVSGDAAMVESVLREVEGYVVPANKNSPDQTVIAGETAAVRDAVRRFEDRGVACAILPVSAAFHSKIVAPATEPLGRVLRALDIRSPEVPIIANVNAQPYPGDREAIVNLLGRQVASPVEWQATIEYLRAQGVTTFVEVGPKRVLAGLTERILRESPASSQGTSPSGQARPVIVATNHPKKGGLRTLEDAVAALVAAGVPAELPDAGAASPTALGIVPAAHAVVGAAPKALAPGTIATPGAASTFTMQPVTQAIATNPRGSPSSSAPLVISGAAAGLPGRSHRVFDDGNVMRLLRGDTAIDRIDPAIEDAILRKRIVRLVKDGGDPHLEPVTRREDVIHLVGRQGAFDLAKEFGLDPARVESWDVSTRLAVAAAIEALRDAGIPLVRDRKMLSNGKTLATGWALPEALRDDTGVILASAWPGLDSFAKAWEAELRGEPFDRKFLFKILAFGHAELAELLRARGPCTQINSACASTTIATAIAEDWIRAGRCKRVIIVGADNVTTDSMLPWMGAGFLAAGAATTASTVEEGALPFDKRRHGMIIGMGAVGIVLETDEGCRERGVIPAAKLLGTRIVNSAFHGSRLDVDHIAGVMQSFVAEIARSKGVSPEELGSKSIFVSHETYTPARGGSASAEIAAIRRAFASKAAEVLIANNKGYTGHPMAAGLEDVLAIKALEYDLAPPIPNLTQPDDDFVGLFFGRGGPHGRSYALRLAAGFGSQLGLAYFEQEGRNGRRIDPARHLAWVARITGTSVPRLEVVNRTLRVAEEATAVGTAAGPTWEPMSPAPQPLAPPVRTITPAAPPLRADAFPPPPSMVGRESTPHSPGVMPVPAPPPIAPAGAGASLEEVLGRLVELVAQKTGYPKDVLDPDLDLEADLGIDTVKQAEIFGLLRDQYQLAKDDSVRIKDYPTLRKIAQYMASGAKGTSTAPVAAAAPNPYPPATKPVGGPGPVSSAPAAMAPPAPARPAASVPQAHVQLAASPAFAPAPSPAPTPSGSAAGVTREIILRRLTAITAEKSGYPVDVLDPALDLEADLGIDTVKQAEIFGVVRDELGLPKLDGFKLKDYPTLNAVAGFLTTLATNGAQTQGNQAVPPVTAAPDPRARLSGPDGPSAGSSAFATPATPAPGNSSATGVRLLIPTYEPAPGAAPAQEGGPVSTAYIVFDARSRDPKELFLQAKRHPTSLGQHLIVVTSGLANPRPDGDAQHLAEALEIDEAARQGAAAGLAKGLARELNVACTILDLPRGMASDADETRRLVHVEAATPPKGGEVREVAIVGGQRLVLVHRENAGPGRAPPLQLRPTDFVVVSGGAQGIAPECVKGWVRSGATFILLGRTVLPASDAELLALTDSALEERRRAAAETLRSTGRKATPVAIEKEVAPWVRGRQVAQTIASLRAHGARVEYRACDVADPHATRLALAGLGPVAVLLHAAGLEESKLLADKDEAAWDRVLAPKVGGLHNLLTALSHGGREPPRTVILFGSVAGRFGNAGQVDYSAANAALAAVAGALRGQGVRATCIDWTAWSGVGMATRGSTLKVLEQAGVVPLTPAEGVAAFSDALAFDVPEVVVAKALPWVPSTAESRSAPVPAAMVSVTPVSPAGDRVNGPAANAGATLGRAVSGSEAAAPQAGPLPPGSFLASIREQTATRVVAALDLDGTSPYLRDHSIDGVPVLAGVLTLEAFVEAGERLMPGPLEIRDAEFLYAIKVLRGSLGVTIEAERDGDIIRCKATTIPPGPDGVARTPRLHAQAALVAARVPTLPVAFDAGSVRGARPAPWGLSSMELYRVFFHGPSFHVVAGLEELAIDSVSGYTHATALRTRATPAAAIEAAFQALGAWGLAVPRLLALPHAVGTIRWTSDAPSAPGPLRIQIHEVALEGNFLRGSAILFDARNEPVLTVEGMRLIGIGPPASGRELRAPTLYAARALPIGGRTAVAVRVADLEPNLERWAALLPATDRETFGTLSIPKRRAEFVAGGLALRAAAGVRGVERPIGATMSHAGGWAVAVPFDEAFERAGIDMETIEPRPDAFVAEAFAPAERASLRNPVDVTRAWCAKEAVLKALGVGLKADLHAIRISLGPPVLCDLDGDLKSKWAALGGGPFHIDEIAWEGLQLALATLPIR
ncbi:MAG: ACP S-malonyltransferase [Thermoplasmatota archaeon]